MTAASKKQIVLPALRGIMGDWVYYSCLMRLKDLGERVNFAEEVHKNKNLSDMIQRQLKGDRSARIAEYLKSQKERFFNSLVVATYEGQPNWIAISNVRQKGSGKELSQLDEDTLGSIGFLTLRGDEKLFALDGQHRLAGIKKAMEIGLDQDPLDEVSVIFVAHSVSVKGVERTRRLFTTINKTARPVSKGDVIALDEDDVMAICARRLIEETELFGGDRIAFVASNNMPVKNTTSLTTIGNLYDLLGILFTGTSWPLKKKAADLTRIRPDDAVLLQYFDYAKHYFQLLQENFKELDSFFSARNSGAVVAKHRGTYGGKVVFRPIGLEVITRVIGRLTKEMPLADAVKRAAKLPRDLTSPPYKELMWDSARKTISNGHKATLREVLLYMLGDYSKWKENALLLRYRKDMGDDAISLPGRLR